jgi:hypothetical protein
MSIIATPNERCGCARDGLVLREAVEASRRGQQFEPNFGHHKEAPLLAMSASTMGP